jgi:hypothetical protein
MPSKKRDKTKVNPISGAEDDKPASPLETVPPGKKASAKTVIIPGTGTIIKNVKGKEAKRVVGT